MLELGSPWLGVKVPAAARSEFWIWWEDGMRVLSICVEDAADSSALSGFVGFLMAAFLECQLVVIVTAEGRGK